MPIRLVDPIIDPLWHDLVQAHPFSSIFHSPDWLRAIATTYNFEFRAVVKTDWRGKAIAGLSYCILDDQRGKRILSIPFSDFSDALVLNMEDWCDLLEPLMIENCPISLRQVHNTVALNDQRFALYNTAKWHGINLQPDLETLWSCIHESARRAIRKSQRMGIEIRIAERAELRCFFDLHLRLRKNKYRLLAQPYAFFENIWKNLIDSGQGLIFLAEYEGKVVGSLFFLSWGDVFTYKFSATNQDELGCRPTDILLWEAMQYGKAQGFKLLDLGLSDADQEGLLRFKRKYASEEKDISFLRYTPPNYRAPESEFISSLSRLTDLLTHPDVPDKVTEEAGNLLYRFFT